MDRQLRDTLVLSSNAERLGLDLLSYLAKVREALVEVEKLTVFGVIWRVDELED